MSGSGGESDRKEPSEENYSSDPSLDETLPVPSGEEAEPPAEVAPAEEASDGNVPAAQPDAEPPAEAAESEEADEEEQHEERMSLLEHLGELRTRVLRTIIACFVGMLVCWNWKEEILDALMAPMLKVLKASGQTHFIYTEPAEAFFTYMKASFLAGMVLVSPYIFFQLWRFIAPGLYDHERKWLIPIAFFSAMLFVTGACFGYFVVFPYGFDYFASFIGPQLQFLPALSTYFGFSVKMLLAFGLIFELPLFVLFLSRLGMVTAEGMRRARRWSILVIFIVAAVLTPPDPFSQCAMALPLIFLYEVSIWVAKIFGKRRPAEPAPEAEVEEERAGEEA